jgi:hypothetical protein
MTWLAWRTQRLQLLLGTAAVLGFGVWMVVQGLHEQRLWSCLLQHIHPAGSHSYCSSAWRAYNFTHWNTFFVGMFYALPGLLGLLVGAPLVAREIEHGTNRVVWAQTITRTRWLAVKLLVAGLVVAAIAGAIVPVQSWWNGAVHYGLRIDPPSFDITGYVIVGYTLMAFMLGVALGALLRRTGWAVLLGLPLFAAFRLLVRSQIRAHLAPVSTANILPYGYQAPYSGWDLHSGFVPVGRMSPAPGQSWQAGDPTYFNCIAKLGGNQFTGLSSTYQSDAKLCMASHKIHLVVQYQPSNHFWVLQSAETAIFIAVAVMLTAVTVLAVRRWRT